MVSSLNTQLAEVTRERDTLKGGASSSLSDVARLKEDVHLLTEGNFICCFE
jgi:hypothetical protein